MIKFYGVDSRAIPLLQQHYRCCSILYAKQHTWQGQIPRRVAPKLMLAASIGVGAGIGLWLSRHNQTDADSPKVGEEDLSMYGEPKKGLPEFSLDDVAKHACAKERIWITYRHGVYDITDFVSKHPGGDKVMLAAGGAADPFWALYAVHKTKHVLDWLESYRIGNLREDEVALSMANMNDPYGNEPRRHIAIRATSLKPFNGEPALTLLAENLITPNELFYIRNHLPVPDINENSFELEVEGLDVRGKTFKLKDIKRFPKHTITAAIQCAGNRRSELMKIKNIKGLAWEGAAIGNAQWTGVRLCDVLKSLGLDENKSKALHVQFEGLDTDPTGTSYGASIPIEKAMDPKGDVLLAYEMNGQPIPRDHGFPLRVIVPGVVGARNVKWLGKIIVSETESTSHWQQNDYKGFAPNVDWDTVDFTKSPAIQEMPVVSAICDPIGDAKVKVIDGKITIKGYAWSGGGRKIVRVDVSVDAGKTWQAADELHSDSSRHPRAWGWTLWTARVPVARGKKQVELWAKAIDSQYNAQPENVEHIWNLRGVLSNAYHKVKVTLVHK